MNTTDGETADGEGAARAGLRESLRLSQSELALARLLREQHADFRSMLTEHASTMHDAVRDAMRDGTREGMREAIKEGLALAVQDEEVARKFFEVGIATLKEQATIATGRFVWSSLGAWVKRWFWPTVIFIGFWYFFGWAALKTIGANVWQVMTANKP